MEQKEVQQNYLETLLSISENKKFITHLLSNNFINELLNFLKDNSTLELTDLSAKIIELSGSYNTPQSYLELIQVLYQIFIRENIVGPSIYTQYVDEIKAPIIKGGPLPDTPLDPLSTKNTQLQDLLLKHFERSSEQIYLKTQFLVFFYSVQVLLENSPESYRYSYPIFTLYKARFYYLWDQQLTSSVVHLQDQSINYYEEYVQTLQENDEQLPEILIEQSYCYLNFYKYKNCKACIKRAMNILKLNLKLTGKLGRRTKYQEFDVAQLVLDVENREVQVVQTSAAQLPPAEEKPETEEEEKDQHKNVQLDQESILYETPLITDPSGEVKPKDLTVRDQIVIQAYVNYVSKTHAKDETRMELLRPYINSCLDKSNNWLVYSKALLQRSRNEIERTKTSERSVLQIQALIDQFRDRQPELGVRTKYYEASGYPLLWQLQRELAKSYMNMGVYVSAYELLREVELYEDCILSMFLSGRSGLAEELANERLAKGDLQQPTILCLLGDIKKDPSYYEKAWEVSGHKFARAMRSRARVYYFNGEYQKSTECYEKALAISRLYPDAWFTLGCAYMRLEDFKQAIFSFGVSISIDDQNQEAWSNISTCHMRQDKYKEAVMCLEQALKHNRKNWKIWENYIILSLETMKFFKAVSASRELMRLDMIERLNVNLMLKICDVFLKNYVAREQVPAEELNIAKKQLYSFFKEYTEKVAKDWQVWRLIGRVKTILKEDFNEIKELKLKEIRALMSQINWDHEMQQ